jgi:hypothetical protein
VSISPALEPVLGVDVLLGAAGAPDRARVTPQQALQDFEALFLETLLRQAGLGRALDGTDDPSGGVAGELFVREIAHSLAGEVNLGLAPFVSGRG